MNKISLQLINIYFKQLFYTRVDRFKQSSKSVNKVKDFIKQFGLILLIIYGIGSFLVLWGFLSENLFTQLYSIGDQKIIIGNNVFTKDSLISMSMTFMLMMLGFINIILTFFSVNFFLNLTASDEILLSLPIKNTTLFSVKVILISLTNGLFFILMNIVMFFIYGVIEKVKLDMYFIFIIQSIAIQFFSSLIGIVISILLVNIFSFLKNKDLMTYLSILFFLPIIVGYNILIQTISQNPQMIYGKFLELISNNLNVINTIKVILGPIYIYTNYIARTIVESNGSIKYIHFLVQFSIVILFFIITVIVFAPIYKKILLTTNIKIEKKQYKMNGYAKYKQNTSFLALFKKEVVSTYREPSYFLNGPFVIILLPLIFGIMIFFQFKNNNEIRDLINLFISNKNSISLLASVMVTACFLIGDFSNITSTAVSREGKNFSIIKTLPIDPKEYIWSKISHGLVLTSLGSLFIVVSLFLLLKINPIVLFLIAIISTVSSLLFHIISLSIDLGRPKLNWDNPIIAMKQNINAVFSIFIAMGYAVLIFFQTKYTIKYGNLLLKNILPRLYNLELTNILLLTLLLLLVLIENIIVYKISMLNLIKKYYEIEL